MRLYILKEIQHVHLIPVQKYRVAADPILPDLLMLTTLDATDRLLCKKKAKTLLP